MARKKKFSGPIVGNPYMIVWLDAAFHLGDNLPDPDEGYGIINRTLGFYVGVDHAGTKLFAAESSEPFSPESCRDFTAIPDGMIMEIIEIGVG